MASADEKQEQDWSVLYGRVARFLRRLGKEDATGRADFWVLSDNWGPKQQKVFINNLCLLRPSVVQGLRRFLDDYPDWEIVVAVDVVGKEEEHPDMGLYIRKHEVIDGLQRQYFPEEFRGYQYENARAGTERD